MFQLMNKIVVYQYYSNIFLYKMWQNRFLIRDSLFHGRFSSVPNIFVGGVKP